MSTPDEPTDRPADPQPGPTDETSALPSPSGAPPGGQAAPTAQWRAPQPGPDDPSTPTPTQAAAVPAAAGPGRFGTALARPRTRVGLAVAGALVVGAAAGSLITAAASDGDGHRGGPREGNARFDRDGGRDGARNDDRDGGRRQQGRFPRRDSNGGTNNGGNGNGGNGNGSNNDGGAPSTVPSTSPSAVPSSGASTTN